MGPTVMQCRPSTLQYEKARGDTAVIGHDHGPRFGRELSGQIAGFPAHLCLPLSRRRADAGMLSSGELWLGQSQLHPSVACSNGHECATKSDGSDVQTDALLLHELPHYIMTDLEAVAL